MAQGVSEGFLTTIVQVVHRLTVCSAQLGSARRDAAGIQWAEPCPTCSLRCDEAGSTYYHDLPDETERTYAGQKTHTKTR
jgi:hypothetical protein